MTNDEEAYMFYVETELSEIAYQLIDNCRQNTPELLSQVDSHSLTELFIHHISVPNPFIGNKGEESGEDDEYWEGD